MDKNSARWLLLTADLIEYLPAEDGVYMLYGSKGKYIEVFSPNKASRNARIGFLTDLDRLYEYAKEAENPYKWKRPDNI